MLVGAVVILCGVVGFTQFRVDSPIAFVAATYAVLCVGIQFTMTPVNTWGVNSLPNADIQHAQSTSNTINQVAASFGTALLVSVASTVSANVAGLEGVTRTFAGYHASFCTTALLAACAVVLILVFVRDRKKAPAVAPVASVTQAAAPAPEPAAARGASDEAAAFSRAADAALSGLTLAQVMNPAAATVRDTACMREVIDIMGATDTTGVSVVDASGKLVGYVTDGDVMRYMARSEFAVSSPSAGVSLSVTDDEDLAARLSALGGLNVMELATRRVISVEEDTPLDVVCGILAKRRIKKVPVTRDGVLVGALSRRNVLHAMMEGGR